MKYIDDEQSNIDDGKGKTFRKYDNYNNVVSEKILGLDLDGKLSITMIKEYDNYGNITLSSTLFETQENKYGNRGKLLTTTHKIGNVFMENTYTYNDNDLIVEEISRTKDKSGFYEHIIKNEYNSYGDLIKVYGQNGITLIENKYDTNNNLVQSDNTISIKTYSYIYYD
jgi:hypothetical protein